jgi:hemerythrin-like domain-containing protein
MATRSDAKGRNEVLDVLKLDHRRVKTAFSEFDKLSEDERERCAALVERTCAELEVHAAIEEEIFYPAARRAIDDPAQLDDAEVEHKTLRMLIQEIDRLDPEDPMYAASFRVLAEYTRNHVKEEEGRLFEELAHVKLDWDALRQEMQQRRDELMDEVGLEREPEPLANANGSDNREARPKQPEAPD